VSRPGITEYLRPASIEEAWRRIADGAPNVRLLSGGSDLTISAPPEVTTLVDIGKALDAAIVTADDGSIHIGAGATLTAILEHQSLVDHAGGVIPEMMVQVGSPLLRNSATIGGHLARGRLSDVVPVLVALDAGVRIHRDGGQTSMSLSRYLSEGHNTLPHILTDIQLPDLPASSAAAFHRHARTAFDFPILNACCRVDLGPEGVGQVRIVCGATPQLAHRAAQAEASVMSDGLTPSAIETASRLASEEVPTGTGWVASAEYRSHLVEVLVARCLTTVAERLSR
jgi:CO/xanthine dehydrogenase FAD-binding subunit